MVATDGEGTMIFSARHWMMDWRHQCQAGFGWVVWMDWNQRMFFGRRRLAAAAMALAWRRRE
jgi:hypothetical protein